MEHKQSSGVQQLINRLRDEGVHEGEKQREQLLQEAKAKATAMLEQAGADAKRIREQSQAEADKIRSASEAALQLAVRDAAMKLREEISNRLASELRELVARQLESSDFLKKALLEVTRRSSPDASQGRTRVLLPDKVLRVEDLRQDPEELENGSLTAFAVKLAKEVLSRGIEIAPGPDNRPGIRIDLVDQDIRIDMTDEAVSQLLLKHLTPRFRALMAGLA